MYVAGATEPAGSDSDLLIVKYDLSQDLASVAWHVAWDDGSPDPEEGVDVFVVPVAGGEELVVVGGIERAGGVKELALQGYDQRGILQWTKAWSPDAPGGPVNSCALFGDLVFAVGNYQNPTGTNGVDVLVSCFDATTGQLLWARWWDRGCNDDAFEVESMPPGRSTPRARPSPRPHPRATLS